MVKKLLTFKVPPAWLMVLLLFLVPPAVMSFILQLQHSPTKTVLANLFCLWAFAFIQVALYRWLMRVAVDQGGISLYRLRTLNWSNIKEARIKTAMGLDYLHIKRQKGMSDWLPLYFKGQGPPLLEAIRLSAPVDNPVHGVMRSRRWDDPARRKALSS